MHALARSSFSELQGLLEIVSSIKPESDLISILIYKGLISHKAFIVTVGYELAIQRGSKPKGAASRPAKPNGQQLAIGRYPSMLAIKDLLADLILLSFRIIIKNNSNENTPSRITRRARKVQQQKLQLRYSDDTGQSVSGGA